MSPRESGPLTSCASSLASSARSSTTRSCRPLRTVLAVYSAEVATPSTARQAYVVASRPRSVCSGFFSTPPCSAPQPADSLRLEQPRMLSMRFQLLHTCRGVGLLGQAVAYPPNSMQVYRAARVGFDLLADHADIDVQRPLVAVERGSPHRGEQLLALDYAASCLG